MAWFKVADGRVVYSGRIAREPFTTWTATKAGSAVIADRARTIGFRLFGRTRAARTRIWRELDEAARSADGRAAIQAAADLYIRSIGSLAYAQGLPRATVALRRLVLVPRTLASARARGAARAQLLTCPAFAAQPIDLQEFFFERILVEADAAARLARPGMQRPIGSADEWMLVGADTAFQWVDQLWSGTAWTGHWFVYERPRTPPSRADRKAVDAAIESLRSSIKTLPRERRHALVKLASTSA